MEYVAVNAATIPDYDARNEYLISNTIGDCMNDPRSPIAAFDGCRVLAHKIDRFKFMREWENYTGRCVVFHLDKHHPLSSDPNGTWMIKELVRCDYGLFYVFRCYRPQVREFSVEVDAITEVCIVDKVL